MVFSLILSVFERQKFCILVKLFHVMSNKKRVQTDLRGSTKTCFEKILKDRDEKPAVVLREIVNDYFKIKGLKS